MIIFGLDGTLADHSHRRHFVVDPVDTCSTCYDSVHRGKCTEKDFRCPECGGDPCNWKPNWPAFYEACYKDKAIESTIRVLHGLYACDLKRDDIEIWSGRCESVRHETNIWLVNNHIPASIINKLKMRPIGNTEPDEVLKERWLDEAIAEGKTIDFVFDSHPPSIAMYRRRGIFVFDCSQCKEI